MKEYKIGQIIDETEYTEAAIWCDSNNATLTEVESVTRDVEEKYTEQVPVERDVVIPAQTHEEVIQAQYDDEGNEISPEHTETVIDEPEHTETYTEYEDVEKTRIVQKNFRQFRIDEIKPYVPTREDIRQERVLYRNLHIDDKTNERTRRLANKTWTEEDETAYLALDAEVTAWIEENLPYPEEK